MKVSIQLCLCVCMLMLAPPGFAQQSEPDLRQEIERLKDGQRALQQELQEIKKLLQSQQPPTRREGPNVSGRVFHLGDNPVKGEKTAMLTLMEFTDYQ
jgi:hypothetical protein